MDKNKTFLVTGATGVIGSYLVPFLIKDDNRVIAVSRNESKLNNLFGQYIGTDSIECVAMDVGETFDLMSISQKWKGQPIDAVFHAASPTARNAIRNFPIDIIKPNLFGTQYILEGMVKQQKMTGISGRVIIFSSMAVYGLNPQTDIAVNESNAMYFDNLGHRNAPYAESKRMQEIMAMAFLRQHGVDSVIVRPSGIYGDIIYPPDSAFYEFINKAMLRQNIEIEVNDIPKRDNIYIDDVINALMTVFRYGKEGEVYNISTGGDLGNYAALDEIARMIADISNEIFPDKINMHYKFPMDIPRKPGILVKNDKLKALGWKPETSLMEGIRKIILEKASIDKFTPLKCT
jgi:nucleoside-diphosphate-sugar epimerase